MKPSLVVVAFILIGASCVLAKKDTKKEATEKKEDKNGTTEKKEEKKAESEEGNKSPALLAKSLLETEKLLAAKIIEYADAEQERLKKLKQLATENPEPDVSSINNPINVYLLIKRFLASELMLTFRENKAEEYLEEMKEKLPNDDDLSAAGVEVLKMQEEKKYGTKELANGDVEDYKGKPFNVDECFHLGRIAYNKEDYYHAALWMEEAWQRLIIRKTTTDKDKIPVLDYLSFALFKEGNVQRAYWLTKELLKLDPKNARASSNMGYYEEELKTKKLKAPKSETDLPPIRYKNAPKATKTKKQEL